MINGVRPDRPGPLATPSKGPSSLVGSGGRPPVWANPTPSATLPPSLSSEVHPNLYWVYVLQSSKDSRFYTGVTSDLSRRIRDHNSGNVRSTDPTGRVQRAQPRSLS